VAIAKDEAELTKLKGEEKILQGLVDKLKGEHLIAAGPFI
jgi:protein kinase C substrate 80K-H